jgi:hypothetical protein
MKKYIVALIIFGLSSFAIAEDSNEPENLLEANLILTDSIYDSPLKNNRNVKYSIGNAWYMFVERDRVGHRQSTDQAVIPFITIKADTKEEFLRKQNEKIMEVIDKAVFAEVIGSLDMLDYYMTFAENMVLRVRPTKIVIHPNTFKMIHPKIKDDLVLYEEKVYYRKKLVVFTEFIEEGSILFLASHKKLGIAPIKKQYDGKEGVFGIMVKRDLASKLIIK